MGIKINVNLTKKLIFRRVLRQVQPKADEKNLGQGVFIEGFTCITTLLNLHF